MNNKVLRLILACSFFLNNIEIFSREFNDGTRKRKNHSDKFMRDVNSGTDLIASQIISNNIDLFGEDKDKVKDLLKSKKFDGEREKLSIKDTQGDFEKDFENDKNNIKENINVVKNLLKKLYAYEFNFSDLNNIKDIISMQKNVIEEIEKKVKKDIKDKFAFIADDKNYEQYLKFIETERLNEIDELKESCNSVIYNINNRIQSIIDFQDSVNKLVEFKSEKINFDNNTYVSDFLGKVKKYVVSFKNINNIHFVNSLFYKDLSNVDLLTVEEKAEFTKNSKDETLGSKIDFKYRYFIRAFEKCFNDKTKEFETKNIDHKKNKKVIESDKQKKFNALGLGNDLTKDFSKNAIKEEFKKHHTTIGVFFKQIEDIKKSYTDEYNNYDKEFNDFKKEYDNLKSIKDEIIKFDSDYKKGEIKDFFEKYDENLKNVENKFGNFKKEKEKFEKKSEIYKNLNEKTEELKENFKGQYGKEYNVKIDPISDGNIDNYFEKVLKHEDLIKNDDFILTSSEFTVLNDVIKQEKDDIKKYIEGKINDLKNNGEDLKKLSDIFKRIKEDKNKKIESYNNRFKEQQKIKKEYLEKIKEVNKKVIDKIEEFENNSKNKVSEDIIEKYNKNFNCIYKDVTVFKYYFVNYGKNYVLKEFIKNIPKNYIENGKNFDKDTNLKYDGKQELIKLISDCNNGIEVIQKKYDAVQKEIDTIDGEIKNCDKAIENIFKNKDKIGENIKEIKKIKDKLIDKNEYFERHKTEEVYTKYDALKNDNKLKDDYEIKKDKTYDFEDKYTEKEDNDEYEGLDFKKIYKIEPYDAKILKGEKEDKNNEILYKIYQENYKSDELLKNELVENPDIIKLVIKGKCIELSKKLEKFFYDISSFKKNYYKTERNFIHLDENNEIGKNMINIINKNKEYVKNNQFISSHSSYFILYFHYKEEFNIIKKDINEVYKLLIKYRLLLESNKDSNKKTKVKKLINSSNYILRFYKKLFEYGEENIKLNEELIEQLQKMSFDKAEGILGEKKFKEKFDKLYDFYKVKGGVDLNKVYNIKNTLEKFKNIAEFDGGDYLGKVTDKTEEICKTINEVKKEFENFKGNFDIEIKTGINKSDLLFGNEKICSDLNILNEYSAKIYSELVFFDKEKDINGDKINFDTLGIIEKAKFQNIYYILKFGTYFERITNKDKGIFRYLTDIITTKLQKLYCEKIYAILSQFGNSFSHPKLHGPVETGFLGNIFDSDKVDLNGLKKIIDDFYKVVGSKEDEDNIIYKIKDDEYCSKIKFGDVDKNNLVRDAEKGKTPEKKIEKLEFNLLRRDYIDSFKGEDVKNFKDSILNVRNLQKEFYSNLYYLKKLYKGNVFFPDLKGGFFTEKYKSFPLGYEIEGKNDDERICYYKLQDGDVKELDDILGDMNICLGNIYDDIKHYYTYSKTAANIDKYTFSKEIDKFLKENFKLPEENVKKPEENFYNKVDKNETILECSKKVLKLLDGDGYKKIKDELKYTKKTGKNGPEFYFNYSFREKFAAKFYNFFTVIQNNFLKNEFFKYECFNVAEFDGKGKIINSDVVIQNFKNKSIDCRKCFNYILNHVNFWGKFFKVFKTINELLKDLDFITIDDEGVITTNDKLFSCPEYLKNYVNAFNNLYSLLKPSYECTIKSSDKIIEIKIPSINNMLAVFLELISSEIMNTDKTDLRKNLLECIISNYKNEEILNIFSDELENAESNYFTLLYLLNEFKLSNKLGEDPTFKILKEIYIESVDKFYGYDFDTILENYGFTKGTYAYNTLKDIFSKELNPISKEKLSDEFSIGNHNLSELVVLVKIIVEKINNFKINTNYDYDVPKYVKDNFYKYIKNCLYGIYNNINKDDYIDDVFNSLNNAKEHCEDIIAFDSIPFEYDKKGTIFDCYTKLSDNLDYIFRKDKNQLKKELDLFLDNFSLMQAYYDINKHNVKDCQELKSIIDYPEEIYKSFKSNGLNNFYQNFETILFGNPNDDNIFDYVIKKKIEFDPNIGGDDNYAKLVNLYKKLNECYDNSDYEFLDDKDDKIKKQDILTNLKNIYSELQVTDF